MSARAIMLMGTGSDVGKSLIAAGLARAFADRGMKVRPFKPQNMSNNAAVTADGGEIGRAQALQARAARVAASVHMNPVLLKPESTTGAQVIVQGKRLASLAARDYFRERPRFLPAILNSYRLLAGEADLVIVEGAGSPGEINLRQGDLANMGFAAAAQVPALLIGDIHRGGVIASIAGTFRILPKEDRKRLKEFIINKFHGDIELFQEGWRFLETETGTPCLGIVPFYAGAARLPAEDAVALERSLASGAGATLVAVLRLPRIANFDDLDPLRLEPEVTVRMVNSGEPIPAGAKLVIIPGSKSTMADLAALRREGWDVDLTAHIRRGGQVLGLCGGYQMLGRLIHDPEGLEGQPGTVAGLGHLDVETTLLPDKTLTEVSATHMASGETMTGYEIHLGETAGPDCARPFARIGGQPDGATSRDGRVAGTYVHGCFASDGFRRAFLAGLGAAASGPGFEQQVEDALDGLALHLETHLDLDRILALAEPVEMSWAFPAFAAAALALGIERIFGYPKFLQETIGHPVEWIGKLIDWLDLGFNWPGTAKREGRIRGVVALALLLVISFIPAWLLSKLFQALPLGFVIEAVLASAFIAQRSLLEHVAAVAKGLRSSLREGREAVAHIVGRDPNRLDRAGVARAALESLAENASDGIVAPAIWYGLLGLPGIVLYKAINTADSMIGHKTERYRHFGWAAARLDDLVNLPASRLTGFLIAAASGRIGEVGEAMRRDGPRHQSPNAGWPEAALAASLGVRLGGPRAYDGVGLDLAWMGAGREEPEAEDIDAGLRLYRHVLTLLFALMLACALIF